MNKVYLYIKEESDPSSAVLLDVASILSIFGRISKSKNPLILILSYVHLDFGLNYAKVV